ncbi:MAG: RagB/SusD family nutrient uptake outer membrane protein [Bacteroidales bacterium]|nr:RagB/SusD family nutrient uptake outer membrane protein [Bacteroidales bacterium]
MKNIRIIILLTLLISVWSCDEKEWLKEEPLDFYAVDNSLNTVPQYRQALNFEYDNLRRAYWEIGDHNLFLFYADLSYSGTDYPDLKFNNAETWLVPTSYVVSTYWNRGYLAIGNANFIIQRIGSSSLADADKSQIEGEALFFRAYWYNFLANIYGGIPLTLEPSPYARTDYVRATRQEVYDQCRIDLERAITLLPDIDNVEDGQVSKQAAQHLLTEVYISLEDYTKAIEVSSAVINHPGMQLMTTRFGTSASETGSPYYDLFQNENQNRSSGNTESILVLQFDYENSGSTVSHQGPRYLLPYYGGLTVENKIPGESPVAGFIDFPENMGGRGIGCAHPTDHFLTTIWGADGTNDNRNAPNLIVRDFKITNPEAAGYGEWLVADGHLDAQWELRNFYPFVMKFSRLRDFPEAVYTTNDDGSIQTDSLGNKLLGYVGNASDQMIANCSLKDEYLYRLAGTYLLRAEAYIKDNQLDLARNDINALRTRANATPADLSEIDLDYLMDEQLRELYFEDYRYVTLARMNKFVERTRMYNPMGYNVADHNGLYPIPFSEIERNVTGDIEQNPGYSE